MFTTFRLARNGNECRHTTIGNRLFSMFPVVCDGAKRQAAADTQKAVKRRWRTVAASGGHAKGRKTQVADTVVDSGGKRQTRKRL